MTKTRKVEELAKKLYQHFTGYIPPELEVGLMRERDFVPLAIALLDKDIVLDLGKKEIVVGRVRILSIINSWELMDGNEIVFTPDDVKNEMRRHDGRGIRMTFEELPDEK